MTRRNINCDRFESFGDTVTNALSVTTIMFEIKEF